MSIHKIKKPAMICEKIKLTCFGLILLRKRLIIINKEVLNVAIQESGEMYLESILILSRKTNLVRSIDVVEYMNFSKPAVSRALARLKAEKYILIDSDGYIAFTESGRQIAEKIYERHTMLTKFLMLLGVDEDTATADACKIEHDISDKTFEAMKQHYQIHRHN